MFSPPLPGYSPDLILAIARGELPRLVLVSDVAGVRWVRPEEAPREAPPYVVPSDVISLLCRATSTNEIGADGRIPLDGRIFRLAALYQNDTHVAGLVEVDEQTSADMWTPPNPPIGKSRGEGSTS